MSALSSFLLRRPLIAVVKLTTRGTHEGSGIIGSREIVGYGRNGLHQYFDSTLNPYPAVRFKEITSSLKALKEKEKGNWRSLCKEEKKCLYRLSFRQTLAEVEAPTGEWKLIAASVIFLTTISLWLFVAQLGLQKLGGAEFPVTFDENRQVQQLQRMLDLRVGTIEGLSTRPEYQQYIKETTDAAS